MEIKLYGHVSTFALIKFSIGCFFFTAEASTEHSTLLASYSLKLAFSCLTSKGVLELT